MTNQLCRAWGGVDEDLAFGVAGIELSSRGGRGDDDREKQVGVAADVADDPDDAVGGVAEEDDGSGCRYG